MKSKAKKTIIIITLGIVFAFLSTRNYSIFNVQGENDGTIEFRNETNFKSPKKSGGYIESLIYIDDSDLAKDWSYTASTYDWCSIDDNGVYIIENVTIIYESGSPTGSGICIENSKNEYFIIRNCTVYNAVSGIRLDNTTNGILTKNNCSNSNSRGI
ncbi:MAG: hypothetical protein HWN81_23695, partial [Candidatus Lokiarchaeota archaeon]|nr:hypothetical protein [Candidatus Lokiarchaeota archaeon]